MEKLTGTYNVVNGNMTSSRQQDAGFAGRIGQAAEIRDSGSVIRSVITVMKFKSFESHQPHDSPNNFSQAVIQVNVILLSAGLLDCWGTF